MAPSGPRPWPGRGMPVRLSSEVGRLPSPGAAGSPPRPIRGLGRPASPAARASPVRLSSEVERELSAPPRESPVRPRRGAAGAGAGAGGCAGRVNAEGSGAGRGGAAGAAGVASETRSDHAGALSAGSARARRSRLRRGAHRGRVARGRHRLGRARPGRRSLLRLPLHTVEKRHPLSQPACLWVSRSAGFRSVRHCVRRLHLTAFASNSWIATIVSRANSLQHCWHRPPQRALDLRRSATGWSRRDDEAPTSLRRRGVIGR